MSKKIPWGPIGYITYKSKYARRIKEGDVNSKTEEFEDTVERELQGILKQIKLNLTQEDQEYYKWMRLNLKASVAGRFMWQLGTSTVNKFGLMSLQNCACVVVDEPIRPFTWAMDALMLGCGVGFNIQKEYVYELPKVKKAKVIRKDTKDADFIVPDSREGWVKLLEETLKAHFVTGKGFSYSTICIRTQGANIRGFGGVASGPEYLANGIQKINELINKRAGKKLNPIDVLDIMNIIGEVVVSGNVRRSAQIALGDMDDLQYLNAKRWDLGGIPNHRSNSNNSIICNDINLLPEQFWNGYSGNGEPYGLINMALSRKVGRAGDERYSDPEVVGYNPCAEQSLANYETCCLAEIYLPNIETKEELIKITKLLYRINKHSLALKCHHPETQSIVRKNMRMGIGVTGYLQTSEKVKKWLKDCYEELRDYDKEYSLEQGFSESIKLTTVKPSGTLSLLPGVSPGAHPSPGGKFYIRRIRIPTNSPLVRVCQAHGYPIEPQERFDGTLDQNTMVVSFPCKEPKNSVFIDDCTAVDQLEVVKRLQSEWSDNSVSCTIRYKLEELEDIKEWLKNNYNDHIKSVSFMLHHGHGFKQAPFEEIDEKTYKEMIRKVDLITETSVTLKDEDMEDQECEGGACPIK